MIYLLLFLVFIFGASLGSFTLVVITRTHNHEKWWGNERSKCSNCGHVLSFYELIPVFSYLFLRGKCLKCKNEIGKECLYTELVFGSVYMFLFTLYIISKFDLKNLILYSLFIYIMLYNSLIDIFYYETNTYLILFGIIVTWILFYPEKSVLKLIVLLLIVILNNTESICNVLGSGDIDVLCYIYLMQSSFISVIYILTLSSIIGIFHYILILRKSENKMIPFVPSLLIGSLLYLVGCMYGII